MIVIHPYDITTTFLNGLYEGWEGVELLTQRNSNSEIRRALNHRVYEAENIMMLGHGCEYGLFADTSPSRKFDQLIINGSHVDFLRKTICIGIWCNADMFADKYGLTGLFTGMIVSEMEEALLYGIQANEDEIRTENQRLAELFVRAFKECKYLADIPAFFQDNAPMDTPLQYFNYNNIHYFGAKDKSTKSTFHPLQDR